MASGKPEGFQGMHHTCALIARDTRLHLIMQDNITHVRLQEQNRHFSEMPSLMTLHTT